MAEPITLPAVGRPCAGSPGPPEERAAEPVREAVDGVFALRRPRPPNPMGVSRACLLKQDAKRPPVDEFDAHDRMPDLDIKPA